MLCYSRLEKRANRLYVRNKQILALATGILQILCRNPTDSAFGGKVLAIKEHDGELSLRNQRFAVVVALCPRKVTRLIVVARVEMKTLQGNKML